MPRIDAISTETENNKQAASTSALAPPTGLSRSGSVRSEQGTAAHKPLRRSKSIPSLRRALAALSSASAPLEWAKAQCDLGRALYWKGLMHSNQEATLEAVAAFREALKVLSPSATPREWARTQKDLGSALLGAGGFDFETPRLQIEAVSAFREAIKVPSRRAGDIDWLETYYELGLALFAIGAATASPDSFEEAVAAYRESLKRCTRIREPSAWASSQTELGRALLELGRLGSDGERTKDAIAALRKAIRVYSSAGADPSWESSKNEAATILHEALALLQLRAAISRESIVATWSPVDIPEGSMPRTSKLLGCVEWSWSPANSREDTLCISSEQTRKEWILWVVWCNEGAGPRFLEFPVARCQRKGLGILEAAWTLVVAFYRSEAACELDRFVVHRGGELLSEEDIEAIGDEVWGNDQEARMDK